MTTAVIESTPVTTPIASRKPRVALMGGAFDLSSCSTVDDVLHAADLDWGVEKHPVLADVNGKHLIVPDRFATVRTSPNGTDLALGVVGKAFTPFQNRGLVEFGDALRGEADTEWEIGGHLRGGRVPFLQFKVPAGVLIAGQDAVDSYVLLRNGHDGSAALSGCVVASRLACGNQVHGSFAGASFKFSIRHVGILEHKVEDARHALGLVSDYMAEFEAIANSLADIDVDLSFYEDFVAELVPSVEGAGIRTNAARDRQRVSLRRNWDETETLDDDLKATGWGVLNLVTEVIDHGSLGIRKSKKGDAHEKAFLSSMEGAGASLRQRAYDMLLEEAEAPGALAVRKQAREVLAGVGGV
jgi:phage/plasmid-like protein (TIGR03299 family)